MPSSRWAGLTVFFAVLCLAATAIARPARITRNVSRASRKKLRSAMKQDLADLMKKHAASSARTRAALAAALRNERAALTNAVQKQAGYAEYKKKYDAIVTRANRNQAQFQGQLKRLPIARRGDRASIQRRALAEKRIRTQMHASGKRTAAALDKLGRDFRPMFKAAQKVARVNSRAVKMKAERVLRKDLLVLANNIKFTMSPDLVLAVTAVRPPPDRGPTLTTFTFTQPYSGAWRRGKRNKTSVAGWYSTANSDNGKLEADCWANGGGWAMANATIKDTLNVQQKEGEYKYLRIKFKLNISEGECRTGGLSGAGAAIKAFMATKFLLQADTRSHLDVITKLYLLSGGSAKLKAPNSYTFTVYRNLPPKGGDFTVLAGVFVDCFAAVGTSAARAAVKADVQWIKLTLTNNKN